MDNKPSRLSTASSNDDGSGTALTLAPLAPPSETPDAGPVEPPNPSRLPLGVTNELDGASELASTNPLDEIAAIGLPLEFDGASVNVAPLPMTSDV